MGKKKDWKRQIRLLGYDNAGLNRFMVRLGRSLEEAKKELNTSKDGKKK